MTERMHLGLAWLAWSGLAAAGLAALHYRLPGLLADGLLLAALLALPVLAWRSTPAPSPVLQRGPGWRQILLAFASQLVAALLLLFLFLLIGGLAG